MKIIHFETFLTNAGLRNYLCIRLHTDSGLTGVGEATLEWQRKQSRRSAMNGGRPVIGRPFDIEAVVRMVRDQYQGGAQ
jgi:galactonate dehydratase